MSLLGRVARPHSMQKTPPHVICMFLRGLHELAQKYGIEMKFCWLQLNTVTGNAFRFWATETHKEC